MLLIKSRQSIKVYLQQFLHLYTPYLYFQIDNTIGNNEVAGSKLI